MENRYYEGQLEQKIIDLSETMKDLITDNEHLSSALAETYHYLKNGHTGDLRGREVLMAAIALALDRDYLKRRLPK